MRKRIFGLSLSVLPLLVPLIAGSTSFFSPCLELIYRFLLELRLDYVIMTFVDRRKQSLRTQGLSFLTEEEREEFFRLLDKERIKHRAVSTKEGDEIELLSINDSVSGVIPKIAKWLHGLGVALLDRFQ